MLYYTILGMDSTNEQKNEAGERNFSKKNRKPDFSGVITIDPKTGKGRFVGWENLPQEEDDVKNG